MDKVDLVGMVNMLDMDTMAMVDSKDKVPWKGKWTKLALDQTNIRD